MASFAAVAKDYCNIADHRPDLRVVEGKPERPHAPALAVVNAMLRAEAARAICPSSGVDCTPYRG